MTRISQYSLDKKGKRGRTQEFVPQINEWRECCELYAYDKQISKHFDISQETFYKFLDKQRYLEEQGNPSEFIEAYKNGRNKSTKEALEKLKNYSGPGDVAAVIFAAKTFGGLIETKDIKHIELKKYEVAFKTKQFLTELANKFELNYEELDLFADKYFKDVKLDDI